jgi:exonuclease SbcC
LLISQLGGADHRLSTAQALLARVEQLRADEVTLQGQLTTLATEDSTGADARYAAELGMGSAAAAGTRAAQALETIGDAAGKLAELQRAQGQAPVLRQSVLDHGAASARAAEQLAAIEVPPDPAQQRQRVEQQAAAVRRASVAAEDAQEALERHLAALGRLRGQRQALGDLLARAARLSSDRERVSRRRAGWVLLERAFGAEGIQALEIDAAGPDVSDIANELLETVAADYTVQLRTVREKTATRKQKEVFDILVHDGRTGTARELSRMSGGEQVIVEEAIKLAIAVHIAQRIGGLDTIWRDESDKGLSVKWGLRYPTMLRAALKQGGLSRCFIITHRNDVACQADSILEIRNGKATVMDPATYAESLQKR